MVVESGGATTGVGRVTSNLLVCYTPHTHASLGCMISRHMCRPTSPRVSTSREAPLDPRCACAAFRQPCACKQHPGFVTPTLHVAEEN
jgi:hypothetical protein